MRFDGPGGEVLAVDAQPLVRPAGEEEPAVGVAVGEIAGPVDAVADLRCERLLVSVVPLESVAGSGVDDLADRGLGVAQAPGAVELGTWALAPGLGVVDRDRVVAPAERASGHRRVAADDDHPLGRAVAVADLAPEPRGELADVGLRGLVPEGELQR